VVMSLHSDYLHKGHCQGHVLRIRPYLHISLNFEEFPALFHSPDLCQSTA
jgi:hypothetical protein